MQFVILDSKNFVTSQWTGGTSTQLYISPAESSYAGRDFDLRISSARVEQDESVFTALPGYQRKLMLLEGELTIVHEQHHSACLKAFEVDSFSGDWHTTAQGRCTDFNVMTRGDIKAALQGKKLMTATKWRLPDFQNADKLLIYVHSGAARLEFGQQSVLLGQAELFVADPWLGDECIAQAIRDCVLVVVGLCTF